MSGGNGDGAALCISHDVQIVENTGEIRTLKRHAGAAAKREAVRHAVLLGRLDRLETKLDRLLDGVRIGAVVAREPSPDLDWDPGEDTLSGREPDAAASTWARRARDTAQQLGAADYARTEAQARAKRAVILAYAGGAIGIIGALGALAKILLGG
jgi:hypothetical protein